MSIWYWICIIGIPVALATLLHWSVYKRYHYICSKCAKTFKPDTFLRSMFALNGGDRRRMRCPYCNAKDWMKAEKDKA